jgi:pullulanase/glycogen debranching enzyme
LSQGVPFFHAGDELLRSKSLDRNSYDSGDWFNRLDYTYQTNNWGVGLPPSAPPLSSSARGTWLARRRLKLPRSPRPD